MKIIIPMAGRGSRLRPHTLSVPKPLISVAGQPIVYQLLYEINKIVKIPITDIGFILGDPVYFGKEIEEDLIRLAKNFNATPHIFRQKEPLGTGHAIICASEILMGPTIVAYADTLIRAKGDLELDSDATIWVKKVDNPEAFGVVELNDKKQIINLIEKPKTFVSDLAVIGIYYFKEIQILKESLKKYVNKNLKKGQEYQINQGILEMIKSGIVFETNNVDKWMDCGNPEATVDTNKELLEIKLNEGLNLRDPSSELINSKIISPCFIGKNVVIKNSIIGPGTSIGEGTKVDNCSLKNCLIQNNSYLKDLALNKAMIGNYVHYEGNHKFVSIGDYSKLK